MHRMANAQGNISTFWRPIAVARRGTMEASGALHLAMTVSLGHHTFSAAEPADVLVNVLPSAKVLAGSCCETRHRKSSHRTAAT